MQLHELKIPYSRRRQKRVGRGGKRGTTSGRGTKGQKSRAGHRIRPASRDLIQRIPKFRGFSNKPLSPKPMVIRMEALMRAVRPLLLHEKHLVVTREVLKQVGLIGTWYRGELKVLGKSRIAAPVTFKGMKVSKGVRTTIERAGGRVEE